MFLDGVPKSAFSHQVPIFVQMYDIHVGSYCIRYVLPMYVLMYMTSARIGAMSYSRCNVAHLFIEQFNI